MGIKAEKINPFGNPSSFFQIFVKELLAGKPEMKGIDSSWIREVKLNFSESGTVSLITVGIRIPVGTRAPINIRNGCIITNVSNGKTSHHDMSIEIIS